MPSFRRFPLLSALLLLAPVLWAQQPPPAAPAAPQHVAQDQQGICQWTVPACWYAVAGEDTLIQFDKGRAAASLHHDPMQDWELFKTHIKQQYRPGKVLEDSAQRLWFQYAKGRDGLHYYVARPAGANACAAQIDITSARDRKLLAPAVERLAQSVAPATPPAP